MGRFYARNAADLDWEVTRASERDAQPAFGVRRKVMGDEALGPWVRLAEYGPGYEEPAHSHDADEVLYILRGDATIGGARYPAGTLLFIERDTTYGPVKAGPEGFQFLLVRPAPAEYVPEG